MLLLPLPPGVHVQVGDRIVVDGGLCELEVVSKAGPDVIAESVEQGMLLSRANLTFRCAVHCSAV